MTYRGGDGWSTGPVCGLFDEVRHAGDDAVERRQVGFPADDAAGQKVGGGVGEVVQRVAFVEPFRVQYVVGPEAV